MVLWPLIDTMALPTGDPRDTGPVRIPAQALASGFVLSTLTLALIWFGVYPASLIDFMQQAVAHLG
jgi:NADH:ubiquinone oxidoreductase subunit 4 (subunit M)